MLSSKDCKHGMSPYKCQICTAERERNAKIVEGMRRRLKTLGDTILALDSKKGGGN